jgi:hypothetical protein
MVGCDEAVMRQCVWSGQVRLGMPSRILRQRGCRMVRLPVLLRSGQSQGGPLVASVSMRERSARSARYGPHEFAMGEIGWRPCPCLTQASAIVPGGAGAMGARPKSGAEAPLARWLLEEISAKRPKLCQPTPLRSLPLQRTPPSRRRRARSQWHLDAW